MNRLEIGAVAFGAANAGFILVGCTGAPTTTLEAVAVLMAFVLPTLGVLHVGNEIKADNAPTEKTIDSQGQTRAASLR